MKKTFIAVCMVAAFGLTGCMTTSNSSHSEAVSQGRTAGNAVNDMATKIAHGNSIAEGRTAGGEVEADMTFDESLRK